MSDFHQLPPVSDFVVDPIGDGSELRKERAAYAILSAAWKAAQFTRYRLTHCWRYDINSELGRLWQSLRSVSYLTEQQRDALLMLLLKQSDGAGPTDVRETILSSRRDVAADLAGSSLTSCLVRSSLSVLWIGVGLI